MVVQLMLMRTRTFGSCRFGRLRRASGVDTSNELQCYCGSHVSPLTCVSKTALKRARTATVAKAPGTRARATLAALSRCGSVGPRLVVNTKFFRRPY